MLGEKSRDQLTIGVVMPVLNCLNYTQQTIQSFRSKYRTKWFIIDNASTDGTAEWFAEGEVEGCPNIIDISYLRQEENLGVSRSWNLGIALALESGCDLAFVINNDLVFAPDTFNRLMDWYSGGLVLTVNPIGPDPEKLKTHNRLRKAIPYPTFIGFLIDHNVIKRIGWFDEETYTQGYFEDDDYKKRLQDEGIPALCCLDAVVGHYGSRTIREGGVEHEPHFSENRKKFKARHGFIPDHIPLSNPPKLLWIGDAVNQSGFSRVTHNVLNYLEQDWEIHVLGLNYYGDPHNHRYPIYPAITGGDWMGIGRYKKVIETVDPDVVLAFNDPFIIVEYLNVVEKEGLKTPVCAYMPIDSKNVRMDYVEKLNQLDTAISYTQFGMSELDRHGLKTNRAIIPHGVDLTRYYPVSRKEARQKLGLGHLEDWFIIGNINNNQPRKRQDLSIAYFAEWLKGFPDGRPDKVALYLHCKTIGIGYDLRDLAQEFGVQDRVIVLGDDLMDAGGIGEGYLKYVYGSLDFQISTSMGEGWGLTQMEGMACGIPQVVPTWAALEEWPGDSVWQVPCSGIQVFPGGVNGIGGVADEEEFITALSNLYHRPALREELAQKGLEKVKEPQYRWEPIAEQFHSVLKAALERSKNGSEPRHQDTEPDSEDTATR